MADNKTFSSKQEKMVAKELGGYQVGFSGSAPANPGDVTTYDWLVECKTHTEPDHSILFDINVWNKIKNEAVGMHRKPVLIVDDGSQRKEKTWCLCRSANINMSNIMTVDFPATIRKNITCKHDKLISALKEATKRYLGAFYEGGAFEVNWSGENVTILPLSLFKELFKK